MTGYYILDEDGDPIESTMQEWSSWFSQNGGVRQVSYNFFEYDFGKIGVSTVFMGMDHNYSGSGVLHIFETMIFRDNGSEVVWRGPTRGEALAAHDKACDFIRDEIDYVEEIPLTLKPRKIRIRNDR